MLSPGLDSAYRQYKQDTDSVAIWLASTAKAAGYIDQFATGVLPTKGRLKGKARKEAKARQEPRYIIAIRDFVPLAEYIRSSSAIESVPKVFINTLDRAIKLRSSFKEELAKRGQLTTTESNDSHSFFVDILISVRQLLGPLVCVGDSSQYGAEAESHNPSRPLGNRFVGLEVQQPSQQFLDAPDVELPVRAATDTTVYEVEHETTLEEAEFAYHLVFCELTDIRAHIKSVWEDHQDGRLDIAAAAVATNVGINLARNLVADVLPCLEAHGGIFHFARRKYMAECNLQGLGFDENTLEGSLDSNAATYEIAQRTFIITLDVLEELLQSFCSRPNVMPTMSMEDLVAYLMPADRTTINNEQKLYEDKVLVQKAWVDILNINGKRSVYMPHDELTRGVYEMFKTLKLPFYLVFAAQVFLDIHHTIRGDSACYFQSMLDELSVMETSLKEYKEMIYVGEPTCRLSASDNILRDALDTIDQFKKLHVAECPNLLSLAKDVTSTLCLPRTILGRCPVLVGLVLFQLRQATHKLGIHAANMSQSVTSANHLYNALAKEGLLHQQWRDMDAITATLGASNFFLGEPASSRLEYIERYYLQLGVPPSSITGRVGPCPIRVSGLQRAKRAITSKIPISALFLSRYATGTDGSSLTQEQISLVTAAAEHGKRDSSKCKPESQKCSRKAKTVDGNDNAKSSSDIRLRKTTKDSNVSSAMLVNYVALAINAESFELTFPYFYLHKRCCMFLAEVNEKCQAYSERELLPPGTVGDRAGVPISVVTYIFAHLAWPSTPSSKKGEGLLQLAAEAANMLILDSGSECLDWMAMYSEAFPRGTTKD